MVLALDRVDGDAVVHDERGRHVVLRREGIRGAEHEVRAAGRRACAPDSPVSVVTCRQAERRTPCSGFSLAKRSRICRRTGIVRSAHSMRSFPRSASERSLTSCPGSGGHAAHREHRHRRLDAGGLGERLRLVGLLPGEIRQRSAEVAEGRRLLVDRPAQVERLDDALRRQREVLAHERHDLLLGDPARAVGLDVHGDRVRHADRVGELNQGALGDARRDEVLRDVAGHVGRRAIDLRRILPGERAAAVRARCRRRCRR